MKCKVSLFYNERSIEYPWGSTHVWPFLSPDGGWFLAMAGCKLPLVGYGLLPDWGYGRSPKACFFKGGWMCDGLPLVKS